MYLLNKYTTWYNNIITQAQQRVNCTEYTEKHHILPRSLGGSNIKSNLVRLTAREHFVCHLLLPKMVTGIHRRSMWYASYMMTRGIRNKHYTPTSRLYQLVRNNMITANKERPSACKGKPNPGVAERNRLKKGIPIGPMSASHKDKLRKPKSEEHKKKLSAARLGKSWGYKHSEETKLKMSVSSTGRFQGEAECEFCKKITSIGNYKRWHGNNCKHNR